MNTSELLLDQFKGLHDVVVGTLKDLSADQLNWQPNLKANSIGFTVWHALRVWQD